MQGVGIDIVEIARIRSSIERHGAQFIDRVFTKQEQAYCTRYRDPAPQYAARFCAKEAIVKALGTGFKEDISWLDIEVGHTAEGAPICTLSQRMQQRFNKPQLLISLSHSRDYATAIALAL